MVKKDYMAKVFVNKGYQARRKATKNLNRRYDEQCTKLQDYNEEVLRANPNSLLKLFLEKHSLKH